MSTLNKIDSNKTGLRYAQELSLGVLDTAANQIWKAFEPNSYSEFGVQITTVARNPINASRQRKKGVVTDFSASAGFNTDITQTNLQDVLQGFFFANLRRKVENVGTAVVASTKKYAVVTSTLRVGDLIFVTGGAISANNGLKRVTAVDATDVTVAETCFDETAAFSLVQVGFQFTAGDLALSTVGNVHLVSVTKTLTQFGIIPGEWIFIGDGSSSAFNYTAQPTNNGFARVKSVSANSIVLDKTAATPVTDTAAAKTIRIFFGRVLKNELGTNIVRRSYALERNLGANNDTDLTKQQADYTHGSVPDKFTINVPTANKVTCDLTFVSTVGTAIDENVSGANTLLSKAAVVAGSAVNAPAIVEADAFNTSSDVSRIKMSVVNSGDTNPTPLFAFVQDLKITIDNKNTPDKAVGVAGAFEVTSGTFEVGGTITAYFANVAAVQSVQANADITLDAHFAKANAGMSFDLPLITLGNGRPQVEQDKAITLPLDNLAATGAKVDPNMDHTLLCVFYDYLPDSAE